MFKLCVVSVVLAVAAMSVNGYSPYYLGYGYGYGLGGVVPVTRNLVDGKTVDTNVNVKYYGQQYYSPELYGYSYGYPSGLGLRYIRDTEELVEPKVEGVHSVSGVEEKLYSADENSNLLSAGLRSTRNVHV